MKILLFSDLHFEHNKTDEEVFKLLDDACGADVIVLAGDIITLNSSWERIKKIFRFFLGRADRVIYLRGNHEYYGSDPDTIARRFSELGRSLSKRLVCMKRGTTVEHGGRRFIGDTLWFPFDKENETYAHRSNDFSQIKGLVPWVYEECEETKKYLEAEVRRGDIVLTHHLPHADSVANEFRHSPYAEMNRFFVCPCDEVFKKRPLLWLHGHTHVSVSKIMEETLVYANPLGYPGRDRNPRFSTWAKISLP